MTVYFQGAELQDFQPFVGSWSHVASGAFRVGNARCGISAMGNETTYLETSTFSASEIWVHFIFNLNSTTISGSTSRFFRVFGNGGTEIIALRFTSTAKTSAEVLKWNGSSFDQIGTLAFAPVAATNYSFSVHVKLGNPGSIRVYIDSGGGAVPVFANDALDVTFAGVTNIANCRFSPCQTSTITTRYSEVIIANWNTINAKLVTGSPRANGTYSEWSGAGYTALNELTPAATYMTSGAADQRISVPMTSFPALGAGERIERVKVTVNALRDASGPQKMNIFARVAMADDHRADRALTVAATDSTEAWETSPATSTYWTPTELNASEFGVRSRA